MPPRQFGVEPIETTTQSSKDQLSTEEKETKSRRRFAPEPVETTTKTNRRFAPQPIEHSEKRSRKKSMDESENQTSKPRKFAVEPVETTTKTNRRFAPEPVETSARSSRKKFADAWESETAKPRRTFAPEPVETSTKTNRKSRKKFAEEWDSQTTTMKQEKKSRKFAPQLIETASRSRRVEEERPSLRRLQRLETTLPHDLPSAPANTPTLFDFSKNPLFQEIQRATSPLNHKRMPRCRPSHHCFHVPDLDPIESSESEGETPSPFNYPCRAYCYEKQSYKEPTRMRESVDEQTSGYLLELAAKAVEKQLREQEMAAFPNGNYHEHVDHFVDADDESTDSSKAGSTTFNEVDWDLKAMRQYREEQEIQEPTSGISPKSHFKPSPWANAAAGIKTEKDIIGYQQNEEIERMRRDARPPMLGNEIKFPRCESPEPARFDTTQGCDAVRIALSYLSEQTQQAEKSEKGESLWCGQGNGKNLSRVSSLWSVASSNHDKKEKEGLWAGFCVKDEAPKGPTGILTPRIEIADLLSPCPTPSRGSLLPPTPPASNADFACIDEKLTFALSIDEDYGDDFVTQVYNYLSLGYPSMAQPFDEELSRISNIPISDLRQDDDLAESKGYIRLGADGNLTDAEITEESCMRWRALRMYIREWAKQHPNMAGDGLGGAGVAVRKGSWAV
ncbi:hypothetical protein P171DRAFT_456442 [Karstenula rhodostoma CBS 690.94]|uniref:Uncharacterized protein n=1 Tax=Karstenula rhodostoma CBS 690.94 TaxID=1392251 RepID=A0A9P4UA03_9PLEO|nr:hypothetical protein P171DRAFT_456442 [Karstenula rhodostoma CBS 690.94]